MAVATTDVAVRFLADASSVEKEADKVETTGSKFKSWAKGVGGAIAGAFAIDQVRDMVNAGAELEDQIAATGVIFGSAAKDVEDWSKTTTDSLGISQTKALDAANTFATFGKSAGLSGDDLSGFSKGLTRLSADMASFRGTSTEQAIQAVGAALRGESEPIRAYGVMLDDATLKARAMSMGLVSAAGDSTAIKSAMLNASKAQETYNAAVKEHGEGSKEAQEANVKLSIAQEKLQKATEGTIPDLTAQQKTLAAQQEIFMQTADAQGDSARSSETAAMKQKKLAAAMEDMQASVGQALLPAMKQIVPLFGKLAEFVEENSTWLVPLVGAVLALVAAYKIFVAIQTAVNAVLALFGVTTGIALGPLILIVLGIAAVIAAVVLLWKNWDTVWAWITNAVSVAWDAIKGAFDTAWGFVKDTFDKIRDIATGVFGWFKDNWPLLLAILTGPFGIAVKLILDNWSAITSFFSSLPGMIASALASLGSIIVAPFQWAYDQIIGIKDGIVGLFTSAIQSAKDVWNSFARFWNSISVTIGGQDPLGPLGPSIPEVTLDLPNLPTLAQGGIVRRPTLAMIGEAGPEAVIPLDRYGTGTTTIVVNVTTTGLGADAPQIQRGVVNALQQYVNRNGPVPGIAS